MCRWHVPCNRGGGLSSRTLKHFLDHSTLRILPVSEAKENVSGAASDEADIAGQSSQSFSNGSLAYVASNVCASDCAVVPGGKGAQCEAWTQEILDLNH